MSQCEIPPRWPAVLSAGAAIITAVVLGGGCAAPGNTVPPPAAEPAVVLDDPTCVSCGYLLSSETLAELRALAARGDVEAVFRISLHYSSADNRAASRHWQARAAAMGHSIAQHNMAVWLRESSECTDRRLALDWMRKSAIGGLESARDAVPELERLVAVCTPSELD